MQPHFLYLSRTRDRSCDSKIHASRSVKSRVRHVLHSPTSLVIVQEKGINKRFSKNYSAVFLRFPPLRQHLACLYWLLIMYHVCTNYNDMNVGLSQRTHRTSPAVYLPNEEMATRLTSSSEILDANFNFCKSAGVRIWNVPLTRMSPGHFITRSLVPCLLTMAIVSYCGPEPIRRALVSIFRNSLRKCRSNWNAFWIWAPRVYTDHRFNRKLLGRMFSSIHLHPTSSGARLDPDLKKLKEFCCAKR